MAIYSKPVRELIPEMVDALAPQPGQVFTRSSAVDWFRQQYPKIKQGTVTAHLIRFTTNAPSRTYYNARPDEDLLFNLGGGRLRRYNPATDPAPIHSKTDATTDASHDEAEDDEGPASPSEFAYESDLRDFLARNLSVIEPGLQLYQDEGITGVEFPAGGRFIDILAVDSGGLVVIELKVSRGYDRVVGQLLRYMAWIQQNHAEPGQSVRGIIAAREISEDLKLACANLPNVSLYEYELSVTLRRIDAEPS